MVDAGRLTDALQLWLDKTFSSAGIGSQAPRKNFLQRDGNLILVNLPGHNYLMGFGSLTAETRFEMEEEIRRLKEGGIRVPGKKHVLSAVRKEINPMEFFSYSLGFYGIKEDVLSDIQREFDAGRQDRIKSLKRGDRLLHKAMFHAPRISLGGNLKFEETSYNGVGVRAYLINVPLGEHMGLSEKLYSYGTRILLGALDSALTKFT